MMAQTGTNEKLYLIGGLTDGWTNDETRPFTTTDGKIYEYVFTADYTNNLPAESADYYFRVKTASQQYQPQNDGDLVKTTFTKADEGSSIAWKLTMTKGKSYTLIFDLTNKQIKYSEGGSEVVTKEIKLLNGSTVLPCSNGKYTLDLSSAASDATITLNIDGVTYGLTTAQTIDAAGTTSDIAFTTEGTKALTLKAGFIYSITVTDEGKMTVVASVDTTKNNPLPKRTYTQGYYLAGNFFTFSGDKVTYDDAVFKFQQQGNDDEGNAVYMVEIPASLTAHAQVMSVDEFGKPKKVYGPGSAYGISRACPETDKTTIQSDLKSSETLNETLDGDVNKKNYWNIVSRNDSETEYSDGMYKVSITVDKKSGEPSKCEFKHISNKRVAFFISDAKNATAMPLYDTYKKDHKQFSNKFFASVNLSTEHSYYVISNYVADKNYVSHTSSDYHTLAPDGDVISCPTTNKLFLSGNGGYPVETAGDHNQFSPNEKPMKPADKDQGSRIIEYNPSKGKGLDTNAAKYLGIRGEVQVRGNVDKQIYSISMVGDAIPGTLNDNGTWNYASTAADMKYDETEKCYKVTLVTIVADGAKKFRFVGNHMKDFNWHEDSNSDATMMAKVPYDGKGDGHAATSYDPNKVNYTDDGLKVNSSDDWNIIWNRRPGRWTVRLYFYTYNVGNDKGDNVPKTEYYYTISANKELELRDLEDVVYMTPGNKRIIRNKGDYMYFRTWSAAKPWKISKDIDIFVVDKKTEGKIDGKDVVKFSLKKISADPKYLTDPDAADNVIPANTGVILATKKTADQIAGGAEVFERASLTEYNTMVVPIEEYNPTATPADYEYKDNNLLVPLITADRVPTKKTTEDGKTYYNYLFGFYHANKGMGTTKYGDNEYLLGFWLSNGIGAFYTNSAYLPIEENIAKEMNLGVSYDDLNTTTPGAKKVPALFFDFANADGTTGIDEVVNTTVKNHDGKYYTLSGQQVEKPTTSGVYIHNGKKFVVK